MALDAPTLATAIKTALLTHDTSNFGATHSAAMAPFYDGMATAIAQAVIDHVKANAVVMPTALISFGSPVTGTGTIT